jgi:6-phosphogluconolactonase
MMKPIIRVFSTIDLLTDYLISRIADQVIAKPPGQFYSVALSGGSTPKAIFRLIAEKYAHRPDWSRVLFFWGDERCVPPSDDESNYRMAYENLFKSLNINPLNICRILGEDNPGTEAMRYSRKVNELLPQINHLPQFDLVLLGLGEDGHTVSIFPYNIGLFHSEHLFETSLHPVTGQIRITATGKMINNAREVCFLATGTGKAEKVAQVLQKKEGWEKLPASLVDPADGQVLWLLDEAAATELKRN